MQILGTKFQIFEGEESIIRRITKFKSSFDGSVQYVLKEKGKEDINKIVSNETLCDKYIRIAPDAFLNIMITKEPQTDGSTSDVYFCVNKSSDIADEQKSPSLILRQNYFNRFKNMGLSIFSDLYIGDCITTMNASKEEIVEAMTFESIEKQISIALYLDDTLQDILMCIPNKFKKDMNATLSYIKSTLPKNVSGTCDTFEQLLEEQDFMGNLMAIFNITKINFPIILGEESYDENGDIILNAKQINLLQNIMRRYISDIIVIKYDKDIDISQIVSSKHIMVHDTHNEIFLIAYTAIGYYADSDDEDVLRSMNA